MFEPEVPYDNLRKHLGEVFRKLAEQKSVASKKGICGPIMSM
jgi:hypothetical protein